MRKLLSLAVVAAWGVACAAEQDPARHVNPFIGTMVEGHTFPGACYPLGLVQPGPDSGTNNLHTCSGYVWNDEVIHGFSQTHLNGTGCPCLGDLRLLPFTGEAVRPAYLSRYKKESQEANPGYYAVTLEDFGVRAEMTCTQRAAIHRYTYNADGPARLLVDLNYGLHVLWQVEREKLVSFCEERLEDPQTLTGHLSKHGWFDREVFFVVTFDRPEKAHQRVFEKEGFKAPQYVFDFDLKKGEQLRVKVAISTVSVENAKKNLDAEIPGWDFDGVRKQTRGVWNRYLGRIAIAGTEEQKVNFYTALYHLFIQPSNIADVNGEYRGADNKTASVQPGRAYYSTFSLWDTFRAAHPLYTVIAPELVDDFVRSMLAHYRAVGYLPVWTLWAKEGDDMIGNHAIPVIADAYFKGFRGFDPAEAFAAMKSSLTVPHNKSHWDVLDQYGYLPFDKVEHEAVSKTLEYAIDDHCAARLAQALGRERDAAFFFRRAQNYRNLFDAETGLMRGRDSNGNWREPFSEFSMQWSKKFGRDYTEGNAWQYTWHVLHDPEGLMELMGGREAFFAKLNTFFTLPDYVPVEGEQKTMILGFVGQYAHGNEPSHHVAYLFPYAGQGWRTAEIVRQVCAEQYVNKPDGLTGNDDCGQMSAWYIFSSLGFYPVNPCADGYVFGAPQLPEMTVDVGNGRTLKIIAKKLSKENLYVRSVRLNGKKISGIKIRHEDVVAGGELVYEMSDQK